MRFFAYKRIPIGIVLSLVFIPQLFSEESSRTESNYKSPLDLVVNNSGTLAYVTCFTAGVVAEVDLVAGEVVAEIPVGNGPRRIVVRKNKAYIACEQEDIVSVVDLVKKKTVRKYQVGQAPWDLTLVHPKNLNQNHLFVICHDQKTLEAVDLRSEKREIHSLSGWPKEVKVGPFRKGLGLRVKYSKGNKAYGRLFEGSLPLSGEGKEFPFGMSDFSSFILGENQEVYVYRDPRTNIPTTQISQGWVFVNRIQFLPLDNPLQAFADPKAVIADQNYFYVVSAGANCVLVCDREKVNQIAEKFYQNKETRNLGYSGVPKLAGDLTLSRKFVRKIIPTGANPRRVALSGNGKTLVVSNFLDDSLTVIDVPTFSVGKTVSLGGPKLNAARRGERLFNSNKLTQLGQFTCASCHPNGQSDGLTWDLTRDGIANFMNTRSLLGVKDTAGYGWYNSSPTLEDRITGTLRNLHRHEPTKAELRDLVAYLRYLPPPRPLPIPPQKDVALKRGKKLFFGKAQCNKCHSGPTFQDRQTHNIGTKRPQDTSSKFDTPSLLGLARTAPYLHDGRAESVRDIFSQYNETKRHGRSHLLSSKELSDLVEYLMSL